MNEPTTAPINEAPGNSAHAESHAAWNANAAYWDEYMGDRGNDFVHALIWPPTQRLLDLQAGERVLDAACGNGLYSRWLAQMGAQVTAFDFAPSMIERARHYADGEQIDYQVLDGTDEAALLTLGERSFDAAICQMALMDMAEIAPLLRALSKLLKPDGRLVFATTHPVFNSAHAVRGMEKQELEDGTAQTTRYMKILRYLTSSSARGVALRGQPALQLYFERSLQDLLAPCFAAGFVLDALEERAFPPEDNQGGELGKNGNFSEFPLVLVARLRLAP